MSSKESETYNISISHNNEHSIMKDYSEKPRMFDRWRAMTKRIRFALLRIMISMAKGSAENPVLTVFLTISISICFFVVGIRTNYYFEHNNTILWSPAGSLTHEHNRWLKQKGFCSTETRKIVGLIHKDGDDVATLEGMEKIFQVVNSIQGLEGYRDLCVDNNHRDSCEITAATGFWDHKYTLYKETNVSSDEEVKKVLSSFTNPKGDFVNRDFIFGAPEPVVEDADIKDFATQQIKSAMIENLSNNIFRKENHTNKNASDIISAKLENVHEEFELTYVKSFLFSFEFPWISDDLSTSATFEKNAVELLLNLDDDWDDFHVSTSSSTSMAAEAIRSVVNDAPLLLTAFLIMTVYCCFTLSRRHPVKSQSMLGIGAVVTIIMSLAAGYGILFTCGISVTPLTFLFPYGMLGLGLDDTFILTGAFERTDPNKDVVERVVDTVKEVGLSIVVTTLTTVVAYCFGCLSLLPGVKWFCIYAAVCISIDFVYQITFFVALMVLDNRRMKANRFDFFPCFKSRTNAEDETDNKQTHPKVGLLSDRIMSTYTRILLKPTSKAIVLILFTLSFAVLSYIASGITQALDMKEIFPTDSYVREYMTDLEGFTTKGEIAQSTVQVVFRDVDVSDTKVQKEMREYVNDLVAMPYVSKEPVFFWLDDFETFLDYSSDGSSRNDDETTESFNEKLDVFLSTPPYDAIYADQIMRDDNGTVLVSSTLLTYDKVVTKDPRRAVEAFHEQERVTAAQTINNERADEEKSSFFFFFTYGALYYTCEMWAVLAREISVTLLCGLSSLFVLALIFVPHPFAAFILVPTVLATFVEVVAIVRLAGLHIDPFTSIGLVVCLGMVMDYNLHVCQAYLEVEAETKSSTMMSRDERVTKTMATMGKSIMKCGFTNLLGVLPLCLNSSLGFRTMFVTFVGFTSVGVAHGLVFLPVVLSLVGPVTLSNDDDGSRQKDFADDVGTATDSNSDTISVSVVESVDNSDSVCGEENGDDDIVEDERDNV